MRTPPSELISIRNLLEPVVLDVKSIVLISEAITASGLRPNPLNATCVEALPPESTAATVILLELGPVLLICTMRGAVVVDAALAHLPDGSSYDTTQEDEVEDSAQELSNAAVELEDTSHSVTIWLLLMASERAFCRPVIAASAAPRRRKLAISCAAEGDTAANRTAITAKVTSTSTML
jgi:hypothetical protein